MCIRDRGYIIKVREEDGTKRYDFQYTDRYGYTNTIGGISRLFNEEFWNYAKLISGVLRYGMPIEKMCIRDRAQTALMMRLTPNICLYDPFGPALEGVAEELYHCGFEGVNITWTTDVGEALRGASYVVSSGGAARKAGMTRKDLLKGNTEIAAEFGKNLRTYCPDVKHVVVIFNPADITGLVTLIYSGLKPSQVSTLAALDSTRLRSELARYFGISPDEVKNCRTYGGHGEQMAVFASTTLVDGKPLSELIGTCLLYTSRCV